VKILKKMDELLMLILKWFIITLCVGIALILLVRVIVRFTPITLQMSWSDEVVEWMMAWMIFTAATIIMRNGEHFRVDLLQTKLEGKTAGYILSMAISLLGILFFVTLLYYSILLVKSAEWFSPILKVSTRVPYMSIPVNCFLIVLYLIRDFIKEALQLRDKRRAKLAG